MEGQAGASRTTITGAIDLEDERLPRVAHDRSGIVARPSARSSLGAIVVIAIVGGVVPILIARHFGAFGIPRGDDAAYLLSAFRFADTGTITGNHWASMNLVGQLFMSVPVVWVFGHRIGALQIQVVALGVVGLVAVFDLAKQLLSSRRALFIAVLVAVGPLWASLSVSYLTDVPAFAFAMVCLDLGARSLAGDGIKMSVFCMALAIGLVAFSIREYAVVAPIAVGLTALWTGRAQRTPRFIPMALALASAVALAVLVVAWRRGLAGFANLTLQRPSAVSVKSTARHFEESALLLGLLVAPVILLAGPARLLTRARARAPWATLVVCLSTAALVVRDFLAPSASAVFLAPKMVFLNQWTLTGAHPDLVPELLLKSLALIGLLSLGLLLCAAMPPARLALDRARAGRIARPLSPPLAIVALATTGYVIVCVVMRATSNLFFTRYLLPLIPLLAILVLVAGNGYGHKTRWARCAGGAALAAVAVMGAAYAATSASFDGTRWSVASVAARRARTPSQVDGGFEWNNYHAGTVKYPFITHPNATCFILDAEANANTDRPNIFIARPVWSPFDSDLWIVARRRGPC